MNVNLNWFWEVNDGYKSKKLSNLLKQKLNKFEGYSQENLRNVLGNLNVNINSIRNKFDLLIEQIKGSNDKLVFWQIRLDKPFPICQFKITGYVFPFHLNPDQLTEELLWYLSEKIFQLNFYRLNLRKFKV